MVAWLKIRLLQIGGIIAGLLFLYGMIRREAWRDFQAKQAERTARAQGVKREVEDEVVALGNSDVDDRLARWVRRDK